MIFKNAEYGTRLLFRVVNKTEDLFLRKGIKITYQTSRHEKELSVISSVNKRAELASHSDINGF